MLTDDNFFEFLHQRRVRPTPKSPWTDIIFKSYPAHHPRIQLPRAQPPTSFTLTNALYRRKTERNFSEKPLALDTIGALLLWSAGLVHNDVLPDQIEPQAPGDIKGEALRRPYPSGGECFPIELYLSVFNGEGFGPAVYHYNVLEHSLELIPDASAEKIKGVVPFEFARGAAALILMSFVEDRVNKLYGPLGYKFGLVEAGHIVQNIYLVGAALGLGILPIAVIDYSRATAEIGLDKGEVLFHQIALGWPMVGNKAVDK